MTPKARFLLAHVIGWLAILAWGVWCAYDWIYRLDGPAYFAADPRRIFWVAAISLIGGAIVFLIMKFPLATRRRFAVILFGTMALLGGAGCIFSLWSLASLSSQYPELRPLFYSTAIEVGVCLLFCGLSILLVRYFRRAS
jgi:hypothetical protein